MSDKDLQYQLIMIDGLAIIALGWFDSNLDHIFRDFYIRLEDKTLRLSAKYAIVRFYILLKKAPSCLNMESILYLR